MSDTTLDSLILDRRTLAPVAQRQTFTSRRQGGWVRRGTTFHGDSASHFGLDYHEDFDLRVPGPAFFDGTETLALRALRNPERLTAGASFTLVMWFYGRTASPLLERIEIPVIVREPARSEALQDAGDELVVEVGQFLTYWVAKDSRQVVRWEQRPGEDAGFFWRFLREGT